MKVSTSWPVLVAEDSPADFLLLEAVWKRTGSGHALVYLNMPRKNGLEALAEMKADLRLVSTPVVMFSTSHKDEDIRRAHQSGASSYVVKPAGLPELVHAVTPIRAYRLEPIEAPK